MPTNESDGAPLTAQQIQADLSSLGRVSHRLAMIDNNATQQFASVVAKLLPKLLVRMGRNHAQLLQASADDESGRLEPLLQQVQAKLMEMLSHILKRVKERTSSTTNASDTVTEPLPCQAILDLLVSTTTATETSTETYTTEAPVVHPVDSLTKNLSLTFLTVGVPKSPNAAPLIPGLLVLLHHERCQSQQSTTQTSTQTTSGTLSLLLLQCLLSLVPPTNTTQPHDDLETLRTFLQHHDECAAVLYELMLDVLLWTGTSNQPQQTQSNRLPPPGLSQYGNERLQPCLATPSAPMSYERLVATKTALVELIAPSRKALLLSGRLGLPRTLCLLLVAKGQPTAVAERAQTYWQMYLSTRDNKVSNKNKKSQTSTILGDDRPQPTSDIDDDVALSGDLVLELVSLTLGQGQAEDIASHKVRALPLHGAFSTGAGEGPIVWANKRRAVSLTPTAATLWTAVATHLLEGSPSTTEARMVAHLGETHLSSSAPGGASSGMSLQQAKPFLACAKLMQAVTVHVVAEDRPQQKDSADNDAERQQLQARFLEICRQLLTRQVTTAAVDSVSSSGASVAMNREGSWAVRDECYGVLCHLCRSSTAKEVVSMVTATLLFACAAKEHERLRPRAVAALDALLEAFSRIYDPNHTNKTNKVAVEMATTETKMEVDDGEANPWAGAGTTTTPEPATNPWAVNGTSNSTDTRPTVLGSYEHEAKRASLARSLVPLLWNAAQPHNPKASRVAAARWTSELLKKRRLDLVQGCHILCFLAGDSDVTAASIANQGLMEGIDMRHDQDGESLPSLSNNETSANNETETGSHVFPDFAEFAQVVFQPENTSGSSRIHRYWDFSFLGKAAALRFALFCLISDLYGGEDAAVALYLKAMVKTLQAFSQESQSAQPGHDRTSIDLLDQCCFCLLTTLKSSSFARRELTQSPTSQSYGLTIAQMQDLATVARSSKARRHLAGAVGALYEDFDVWGASGFSDWMSKTGVRDSLSRCVEQLSYIEKSHFQIGKLHGIIFLSGHALRAIRHRLLRSSQEESESSDRVWQDCTSILKMLGSGVLHKEEVVSNASVDAIGKALSFDSVDAPPLDPNLNDGVGAVLKSFADGIKKFSDGDATDHLRATGLVRAAGVVLGASSLAKTTDNELHQPRHRCVEQVLSVLGSQSFRKDEEIALAVGESLGEYADSCIYEASGKSWPHEYQEDFALQLPPQEYVSYYLMTNCLLASSPRKRTATAAALLGLVGRASRLVHIDGRNADRSFAKCLRSKLSDLQNAFIRLLADPKIRHFSRESCCLGIAACHGLATLASKGARDEGYEIENLNQRLFRAFGQTTSWGSSAYQETNAQAERRRAAEQSPSDENTESNILEPFGMENEVGGAAGMGEAALGAYREMAAASLALERPDILYGLLVLSVSHEAWFRGRTRENYNAMTLLPSQTNTLELRSALRPHLGKLLPRILRACNDPNKQTREQMTVLFAALAGGGAESREAITANFLSIFDVLIQDSSNKLWRARSGATGALADIIVGRDWLLLGGGPPVLSDDEIYGDRPTSLAGVRLLRLWRVVIRAIDDVRDAVRTNGERLGRAVRALTIRLSDPSTSERANGEQLTLEGRSQWARDASSASATSLRWLVKHGLNQPVPETQGLCTSTLVELIKVTKPGILEPSLPDVLRSLLMAMSALEPAALNYVQLRTDNQEGLERARLQLAQSGPLATAVGTCLDHLPNAKPSVQNLVVSELDTALRLSVGFATRAATGDAASMLANTCPDAFSFPGAVGSSNPSVRLMRAFYYAAERERGPIAKDRMIHALGSVAALCPSSSVRSLAVRACRRYKSAVGNFNDPASRRAAAAALRAITVRASNHLSDGGSLDVWSKFVLPVSFLGRMDSDKKTASLMKEVWEESGAAVESPSTVRYGTSREEQLLPGLVNECIEALQDVSWERRVAGAKALEELCDLGALAPLARSTGPENVESTKGLERSRRRANACFEALVGCTKILQKPRLWTGKSSVVSALSKIASKWTAIQDEAGEDFLFGWDGVEGACSWIPVSMANGNDADLFLGDNYFRTTPMDVEEENAIDTNSKTNLEGEQDEVMDDGEVNDDNGSGDKIEFPEMDEEEEEHEGGDEQPPTKDDEETSLTFVGASRLFLREALPLNKRAGDELSEECLPYRTACLRAFCSLAKSLAPSDTVRKSFLYSKVESRLLSCIQGGEESKEAPIIVACTIDCLSQLLWDGFGSSECMVETVDTVELCTILRDASGKHQPAWTVRRAGGLALASLVSVCDPGLLRNSRVISMCIDSSRYLCSDKKFWRCREAGLRLVGALIRRVGSSSAQRDSLLLDALLPHKEDISGLLRKALSDSEPAVTALSSEYLPMISWWP